MSCVPFLRRLAVLSVALAAFAFSPAHAQTAPGQTAPGGAPGQGAPAAPKQTREQVQDWGVRCLEVQPKRCEMVQVLSDRNSRREVLVMVVGYAEEKTPLQAAFVLPLGVLLPPGLSLRIDQGVPKTIRFRHCEPQGCIAPWQLTEVDLAALRAGTALTVTVNNNGGKPIELQVSLKGFTAAAEKVR